MALPPRVCQFRRSPTSTVPVLADSNNRRSSGGNDDDADGFVVTLNPGCKAVSLQFVDLQGHFAAEFGEFLDKAGRSVVKTDLPHDYAPGRALIGLVSKDAKVAKILVSENANDSDDVAYDDFTSFE